MILNAQVEREARKGGKMGMIWVKEGDKAKERQNKGCDRVLKIYH